MLQQLTALRVMSDEFFENSFSEYIIAISILQFPGFTAHENLYSTNIKNSLQCKAHYREFYYVKNFSTLCFVTEFLIVTKQLLYVDYFWA